MNREQVICNQCGQAIPVYAGKDTQDYLLIEKTWGYFSEADGVMHRIHICEPCYHKWIQGFAVPIEVTEVTEIL